MAILLRSLAVCENVRVVQSVDIPPPFPYYFGDIVVSCEESIEEQRNVRKIFDCNVKSLSQRNEDAVKIQLLMRMERNLKKKKEEVTVIDIDRKSSLSQEESDDCVWLTVGITDTNVEQGKNGKLVPVQYVVAMDCSGSVVDITYEFASNIERTKTLRITDEEDLRWLGELIHSGDITSMMNADGCDEYKSITMEKKRLKMEPLPKSISGFMKSNCYILESQIGKTSIVRPFNSKTGKKTTFVALFNGEKVYDRNDISKLESSSGWRKFGREVNEGEIPISTINRKRGYETFESKLYGDWQTIPIKILEVIDGVIPSNEHGNIEIWNGNKRLLPIGTSLVQTTKSMTASKIAVELGIQHRRALFGFEDRQETRCPVFGGIVVLQKDVDIVKAALDQVEHDDELRKESIRKAKVLRKWQALVSRILTRLSLKERYNA